MCPNVPTERKILATIFFTNQMFPRNMEIYKGVFSIFENAPFLVNKKN